MAQLGKLAFGTSLLGINGFRRAIMAFTPAMGRTQPNPIPEGLKEETHAS
jgi:hypothetical protein